MSLALLAAVSAGCGHATVPCPTPTALLDSHRRESLEAQRAAGDAAEEQRALKERRDEARRRIAEAAARLDSLEQARAAAAGR